MRQMRVVYLVGGLWLLGLASVPADEGRRPLFKPTLITEPGNYVVTRNISVDSGNVLTINCSNVTIDLNGNTLASTSSSGHIIELVAGSTNIVIENGRLSGGDVGVYAWNGTPVRLRLEDTEILSPASYGVRVYRGEHVEIVSCRFSGGGVAAVSVQGDLTPFNLATTGRFERNVIDSACSGFYLTQLSRGLVRDNMIRTQSSPVYACLGISITDNGAAAGGSIIAYNTIQAGTGPNDEAILVSSSYNTVDHNTVSGGQNGIGVTRNETTGLAGNVIEDNVVSGCVQYGIIVGSTNNLVQGNKIGGNGLAGLALTGASSSNAYRNNMLRGNPTAVLNQGVGNTDEGGNVF